MIDFNSEVQAVASKALERYKRNIGNSDLIDQIIDTVSVWGGCDIWLDVFKNEKLVTEKIQNLKNKGLI